MSPNCSVPVPVAVTGCVGEMFVTVTVGGRVLERCWRWHEWSFSLTGVGDYVGSCMTTTVGTRVRSERHRDATVIRLGRATGPLGLRWPRRLFWDRSTTTRRVGTHDRGARGVRTRMRRYFMRASQSDVRVRWGAVGCHDGATDDWKIKKPQKKSRLSV